MAVRTRDLDMIRLMPRLNKCTACATTLLTHALRPESSSVDPEIRSIACPRCTAIQSAVPEVGPATQVQIARPPESRPWRLSETWHLVIYPLACPLCLYVPISPRRLVTGPSLCML